MTLLKKLLRSKRQSKHLAVFSLSLTQKISYFFLGTFFSLLFIFLPLLSLIFLQSLPHPTQLSENLAPQTTKIYDRNGVLLYQIYANQNRTIIPLTTIPSFLQDATIAIEDKNFYKNPGFDIGAIVRAALVDISKRNIQGGSTITQQLIKSSLLTSDRTILRKVQEVILAFWAEKLYSKKQILAMYFNQVPYGGTAWGVEAAAQTYLGKSVKDVNLAEAAFLAGMPQAPTTYSPFGQNATLWKERQKEVLDRMTVLGFITKKQEQDALAQTITFRSQPVPILAPHFVMYIRDLLTKKYGLSLVEKGGLQVITTLDIATQNMAQDVVSKEVAADAYLHLTNGAALVTNPKNGDILAMVGSKDYNSEQDGNVNVTTSLRQPGSTMKLVTYSGALLHGFTAASILDDSPISFPLSDGELYSPVNYDGRFHGRVPLRIAFANSFNIPAVKTLNSIGVDTFIDLAKRMGITTFDPNGMYGLSITLGGFDTSMVDLSTVYGTIANAGNRVDLNPIIKVTDNNGNVLEEKQLQETKVVSPQVSFIVSNILSDNNARSLEFGNNSPLQIINHLVSVKTGTSDDKRDNWTVGYPTTNPHFLVAVWVGNNDNSPMSPNLASGITGAAPIWHNIMDNLLKGTTDEKMATPDGVIAKPCGKYVEYFVAGTESGFCNNVYPTWTPTPKK